MAEILTSFSRIISRIVKRFRDDRLSRIFAIFLILIIIAGISTELIEKSSGNPVYQTIGDGLWWTFVTMTTVGYGDKTPVTTAGRLLAIVIMFSGISFTALFTALVASYFVEKRIREGRGMEQIKWKQHIVMCGWNSNAMKIVNKLTERGEKSKSLVLVNDLPEEHIANILESVKHADVRHVRGDFVHEGVLQRANVSGADIVIILADRQSSKLESRPDDRTTLACFTARSLNHRARICAEVESEENIAHLKRASVDTIIYTEGYNPFLIANAALQPGVTVAVQDILSWGYGHSIQQKEIPSHLVEKKYSEVFSYFKEKEKQLLIGVVSEEEEGMGLDDILSGDMSAVDRFIKKKFEGIEDVYFTKRKSLHVKLNMPDDYTIRPTDKALVIAKENS